MAYRINQRDEKLVKNTERFLQDYRVRARVTNRQMASYDPVPINFPATGPYPIDYHTTIRHYSVLELEMSENDLDRLVDDVQSYKELLVRYGNNIVPYLNNAHDYAQQISYEFQIRKENPGVQKAWDNYQLMLKVAGGK